MGTSPRAEIQTGTRIRAGLYLRSSRDRAQRRLAVYRQEEDCRQIAERLGWFVARVYIDNGVSASRFATKARDEYRHLLDDIRAGRIDAVVVWMEDRSHRQVAELAEFVKTCQAAGIRRYAAVGAEYDLSDPDQVSMLSALARVSEIEVDRISTRLRRKVKELADNGQYHGGPKPYGYEGPIRDEHGVVINRARIGKAIVDEEATVVREAARRILDGESRSSSPTLASLGYISTEGVWSVRLDGPRFSTVTHGYGSGLCSFLQTEAVHVPPVEAICFRGSSTAGSVGSALPGCPTRTAPARTAVPLVPPTKGAEVSAGGQSPLNGWCVRRSSAMSATTPNSSAPSGICEYTRQHWESASQERRRELIDAVIEHIIVLPQATSRFNPDSIKITWRIVDSERRSQIC